jgi:hypothetical protein
MLVSLLALMSQFDTLGRHHAPGICFAEPDEGEEAGGGGGEGGAEEGQGAAEDGAEEGDEEAEEGDEEGEGDEAEDEGEEDAEAEEAEERPAARSGRANERIRRLAAENKRLKESERRFNEMLGRGPRSDQPDPAAARRQYEEEEKRRLDEATQAEQLGNTGAVARYWANHTLRETGARIQQSENRAFERDDKRDFRQICREDGISASLRDWVEENIQTARANGNFALTREALLNHRLGQLARAGKAERLGRQQERGNRRILRQTVKPPRGGSDQPRPTGRRKRESEWTAEDYEKNLGDKSLIQR